jgi:hypothetical protein
VRWFGGEGVRVFRGGVGVLVGGGVLGKSLQIEERDGEMSDEPKRAEKENSVRWQLLPEAGRQRCLRSITSREGGFLVP